MPDAGIDALVVVSFGGPEGPDDVMPFLENVTRGRNVPRERLEEVAEHYLHFGGISPINDQNRALVAALTPLVAPLPVYWGNRNWAPYLTDTVRQMRDDGVRRAAAYVTSAYRGYSSCRQYREDIARARAEVGEDAPELLRIAHFSGDNGFLGPMIRGTREALASLDDADRSGVHVVFTAHSVPASAARESGPQGNAYPDGVRAAAERIAASVGGDIEWSLAWQSRSGPPQIPWLEPDICDHLDELAASGVRAVIVVPVGFVSDHMEVMFDLDVEAAERAAELGLVFRRVATPGIDPDFVAMIARRAAELAHDPATAAFCEVDCCLPQARPTRHP